MDAIWSELGTLERVYFFIAVPSTIILIIQMIMLFLGGAGMDDFGADAPDTPDGMDPSDIHGLRVFSVSGILGLCAVTGWSGVALLTSGVNTVLAVVISLALGIAAMIGIAFLTLAILKLAESGNADYQAAIGKTAQVYLTIPASGKGQGKINIIIGEALREFAAVTDSADAIPTGAAVRITGLSGEVFTVSKEEL